MATRQQAETAFANSRAFFSAKNGALKSTNKAYMTQEGDEGAEAAKVLAEAKGLTQEDALARVTRRAQARLDAVAQGMYHESKKGLTPVEYGKLTVQKGASTGNCGLMACVAMYYASLENVPTDDMWLVTVYNSKIKQAGTKITLAFGHSYAQLGSGSGKSFIVDPWAGVCCKKDDYAKAMKASLKDWHAKGKRILVNWSDDQAYWTNATDIAVLGLLSSNATKEKKLGTEKFR